MNTRDTRDTSDTRGERHAQGWGPEGPAPLHAMHTMHAICLEVADRAQAVAWRAYVQDRRPNAGIAAGLGVLAAYLRLGGAVEALLNALADAERPAEGPAEQRGPR